MTTTLGSPPTESGRSSFNHRALFYRGQQELVRALVPFIEDGLAAGDSVLVALAGEQLAACRSEVPAPRRSAVTFLDMVDVGRNPAAIIPIWQSFVDAQPPGTHPRGVGEPVWPGRSDTELDECIRHEALLNVAFSDLRPWTLLCPYDIRRLPAAAVSGACQTHRFLSDHNGSHTSATYGYGWPQLGDELSPVPRRAAELAFSASTLRATRTWIADQAETAGIAAARIEDVVLAVGELCANSVLHGGGHGRLRVWTTGDALVCEVTDPGVIIDPLAGRYWPDPDQDGGRGLWLANKLCDLVQLRSAATGTRVRVHLRLTSPPERDDR